MAKTYRFDMICLQHVLKESEHKYMIFQSYLKLKI